MGRLQMRKSLLGLLLMMVVGVIAASLQAQQTPFEISIVETRADMEILADAVFGADERPETWTGNREGTSPTFVADLWFDNEQLAGTLFSPTERPAGWIGATSPNAFIVARNVRHDLELLADEFYGAFPNRPPEWRGGDPLYRCERTVLNLAYQLQLVYGAAPSTPLDTPNYCAQVQIDLDTLAVNQLFNTPDQTAAILDETLAVRGDLERLADERLGLNTRPPGWIGNRDLNSISLASDLFLDLELLADNLLGTGVRPAGWAGGIGSLPYITYRNLRGDLERLTNETFSNSERPRGWQNTQLLAVCDPLLISLATIVQANSSLVLTDRYALPARDEICAAASNDVNLQAENPPAQADVVADEADSAFIAESQYAFVYLDRAALQYMGIMPGGTVFRAWYRNFNDSSMMYVTGDGFAVYIDRRWTTMPQATFDRLPTWEGLVPEVYCDATWCNGPGPTPTPTGGGALEQLVFGSTPPAPEGTPGGTGTTSSKTQVSWNNVRVTYLEDNVASGFARVALEICAEPTQITCEAVTAVFDNNVGAPKPVISQFNGLNVYEFRYGYTTNLVIEGATYFSPDVWISDPTIRN